MNGLVLPKIDKIAVYTNGSGPNGPLRNILIPLFLFFILIFLMLNKNAYAIDLPGEDLSQNFETASSLLRTVDSILFAWGAPILAAIFLFWATFALIQQKIVMFFIALIAAIFLLVVPKFVKDLKDMSGGTVFSYLETQSPTYNAQVKQGYFYA